MLKNAYEQNQRDAKHQWGCNKGNKETKEKPDQENKSLVGQKTLLIEDGKRSKDTPTFTEGRNKIYRFNVQRKKA